MIIKLKMLWFGKKKNSSKNQEVEETNKENKLDLPELPELYPDSSVPEFEETNKFMNHQPEKIDIPKFNQQEQKEIKKITPEIKIGPNQHNENLEQVFDNIIKNTKLPTPNPKVQQEKSNIKKELDSIDFSKLALREQTTTKIKPENLKEINQHIKKNQTPPQHTKKVRKFTEPKEEKEENFFRGNTLFLGNKNYLKISEALNQLSRLEELNNLMPMRKRETELESKFKEQLETIYDKFLEIEETIFGGKR